MIDHVKRFVREHPSLVCMIVGVTLVSSPIPIAVQLGDLNEYVFRLDAYMDLDVIANLYWYFAVVTGCYMISLAIVIAWCRSHRPSK